MYCPRLWLPLVQRAHPTARLQEERLSDADWRAQRYIHDVDVHQPNIIQYETETETGRMDVMTTRAPASGLH